MTKEQHKQSDIDYKKLKERGLITTIKEAIVFKEAYKLALNIPLVGDPVCNNEVNKCPKYMQDYNGEKGCKGCEHLY